MKHLAIAIYATVLCITLYCCTSDQNIDLSLQTADNVINTAPDSALRILSAIDTRHLSGKQRALHALLFTKASDKNYMTMTDDSLISIAADYYAGRGDSLEVQSLYYLGETYSYSLTNDTALVVLHSAYDKALDNDDYFYAAMSASELAVIYRRLYMTNVALKWARTARLLFTNAKKPVHAAWTDILIADNLIFSGYFDKAHSLLDSMTRSDTYKEGGKFKQRTLRMRIGLANQYDSLQLILALYDSLAQTNYTFTAHDRLRQAHSFLHTGKTDSAEKYISKAVILDMGEGDSLYHSKLVSEIFAARNEYKKAYEAMASYSNDLMVGDIRKFTEPKTVLLTDNYRIAAENHRLQVMRDRDFIIGMAVFILLLMAIVYLTWKYYNARLTNKRLEIERLVSESELLREDLTLSVSHNRELSENSSALRREIKDRESDFIKEARSLLSRHLDLLNNMCEIWYHNKTALSDNHLYKEMNTLLVKMSDLETVEELAASINKHDNDWVTKFKKAYPNLRKTEYQLAIYLYLGFRPSTIAVLSKRENTQAVHIAKYKLKKKLLAAGGEDAIKLIERLHM